MNELMSEHRHLQDEVDHIRRELAAGDRDVLSTRLDDLLSHLTRHVAREEHGIFAALRRQGEYADEVDDLETEHRWLNHTADRLEPHSPRLAADLDALFEALEAHIQREDLGIFPVSVVTLGAEEWDLVQRAHEDHPSFLGVVRQAPPSRGADVASR